MRLVNVTTAFAGTTAFTVVVGTTTTTNSLVTVPVRPDGWCAGWRPDDRHGPHRDR
jgi:hypothetical protein